ncbi:MAG TPA: hypothetical protein VL240_14335 [Candidatus Binatia bacterium]|nr:hypothetical protein [Candidatus Binatia bacterium]
MFGAKRKQQPPPQPALSDEQIAAFTRAVADYIRAQRSRYYSRAVPLKFSELWLRYFPAADLERVRVLQPGVERVFNPPFYAELERLGFTGLPDFGAMAAITFDDVAVFHRALTPQLLFHELVHMVQYRLLGIDEFARLYVRGYLHGGYDGTPLEICAYELDGRFIMSSLGFDVVAEVKSWIAKGRF